MPALPLITELIPAPEPEEVFRRLWSWPHCVWFDSALRDPTLGRYSYLAADPFQFHTLDRCPAAGANPLTLLTEALKQFQSPNVAGLPPFQGGAAAMFSYDFGGAFERLPAPRFDEFRVPVLALGFYDVVVAYDHEAGRCWLIAQGFPEVDPDRRERRAAERQQQFRDRLLLPQPEQPCTPERVAHVSAADLAPQFAIDPQASTSIPPGLTSNFSSSAYLDAVRQAIAYIRAGDIFQVNLAQRLLHPAVGHAAEMYLRLRRRNPATFAAWFDLGEFQIASASPERFLQVQNGQVEARPIKGTRRRSRFPEADLYAGSDLQESEKDRAENVMIVDLLRNDLSRVCLAQSMQVTQLCRLETYAFVQHLVSAVRGQLRAGRSACDCIPCAFPGGSITGAPKIRAMEIIAELEPTARGPYCGSLAWFGWDGSMDSNILIRTLTCGKGWWQAPVGGGIVAQSIPAREYEETWHKAEGLLRALL